MGEMGMSEEEFYTCRVANFFLKLHGFREKEYNDRKEHANLVRMSTFELININLSPEHKIKSPESMWPFPWDNEDTDEVKKKSGKKKPGITEEQSRKKIAQMVKAL